MFDLSTTLNINVSINDEFNISNLIEAVLDCDVVKLVIHQIINKLNDIITLCLCGERYKHNKENYQYERREKRNRKIITKAGEMNIQGNRIRDKETGEIFIPLFDVLGIENHKNYQIDINWAAVDIATKSTYRDTIYILKKFLKEIMSPATVCRNVKELGQKMKEFVMRKNKENKDKSDHFLADSTMSHSQEKNKNKNNIKIVMTKNSHGEKILLSCAVNKSWKDVNTDINNSNIVKSDAVLISDAEPGLIKCLACDDKEYQLDFIHFVRDIGYNLWKDNKLSLNERKEILKEIEGIIYKMKNQIYKYEDNEDLLKEKINECVDKLKKISKNLIELKCFNASKFIKKHSNNIVTFAIVKTEGKDVPWNSNLIERLMGEIMKRCKHKWMRWTTEGQEAILYLILTRYTNPQYYEEFKNEILQTKNKQNIQIKITT